MNNDISPSLKKRFKALPKIELHAHLHGSVRRSTLLALISEHQELIIPQVLLDPKSSLNLESAFQLFDATHKAVNTIAIVKRIATEALEDMRDDGVVYVEFRTTPRALPDGTSKAKYVEELINLFIQWNKRYGRLQARLLISLDRGKPVDDAQDTLRVIEPFVRAHRDILVGLDLSGDPRKGSFVDFMPLLKHGREQLGLKISVHAAEVGQSSDVADEDTEMTKILRFRPDRLGHALFLRNYHLALVISFLQIPLNPLYMNDRL